MLSFVSRFSYLEYKKHPISNILLVAFIILKKFIQNVAICVQVLMVQQLNQKNSNSS